MQTMWCTIPDVGNAVTLHGCSVFTASDSFSILNLLFFIYVAFLKANSKQTAKTNT